MRANDRQQYADKVRKKIRGYTSVLKMLVVLEHKFSSLENVTISQGKKLCVAGAGGGAAKRRVTPDLVIESDGLEKYRAVVEIKESLPARPENWNGVIAQLEKYKIATGGWDTAASSAPHDVMLATGMPYAEEFASHVGEGRDGSGVGMWVVVVRMVIASINGDECMKVSKIHGQIGHPGLDKELSPEANCLVPLPSILTAVNRLKFYDSNPPLEYTMSILWDHVFSKFFHGKKLQKFLNDEKVTISITMRQLMDKVADFAPRSNQGCVRQSWVSEAMSAFEKIGAVSREADGLFNVTYEKHDKAAEVWIIDRTARL